jgi:hypothetical protein
MNESKQIRVDQLLLQLIKQLGDSPFSTTEIRDLYAAQISHPQKLDRSSLRKHIYRELLRLESAGVLKRHHGETGRGCKFIYRGVPEGISFEVKPSPFGQLDEDNESTMDPNTVKGLREELSTRKVELMASIGEAEEYQRLYNKFPALQKVVKTQYLESRDRSTKLLGQLRAVETVLKDIGFNA